MERRRLRVEKNKDNHHEAGMHAARIVRGSLQVNPGFLSRGMEAG